MEPQGVCMAIVEVVMKRFALLPVLFPGVQAAYYTQRDPESRIPCMALLMRALGCHSSILGTSYIYIYI